MILGYPSAPSAFPGDTLLFHVSTDAPELRIELYRQGTTLTLQGRSEWLPGRQLPLLAPYDDWSKVWPGYAFALPESFPPGVYVAMFVEGDGEGHERPAQGLDRSSADARRGKALFVLRSRTPSAAILYKIPLFTYCAYNGAGDPSGSLYTWPGRKVTLHRPGNGTGATPTDAFVPDFYDLGSPRQTFEHWDAKFIRWLEGQGRAVDYATDLDVHRNEGDFLSAYRLLLSVGHDEYWSAPMRAHVEAFVARGGNVALFSGNVCWWRVTLEDGETSVSIDKRVHPGESLSRDAWYRTAPENALTGVSYRSAGGHWDGPRPSGGGYTVERAGHWVFAETGLADGAVFGEEQAVVGYECDGAALARGTGGVPIATGADCSPLDLVILATSRVADWEGAMEGEVSTATMSLYTRRGTVFSAATVDWPRVLAEGDPVVERITRNVLDRLAARSARVAGPFPARCGRSLAVEGETGTFYVDTRALSPGVSLRYRWAVSAGAPGPLDGPTLSLTMPSPPVPVTVSVIIEAGDQRPAAFGTLTVQPFSRAELAWFEITCEVERLGRTGRPPEKAPMRPGEGDACLPGSLYDPLDPEVPFFSRPEAPPLPRDLEALREGAERIAALARGLLGEGKEPERS